MLKGISGAKKLNYQRQTESSSMSTVSSIEIKCVLTLSPLPLLSLFFQNADDLLVASAECPSDDEDLEECEPGNGESTQGVLCC